MDREKVINQLDVDIQRAERTGEMLVYVGRKTAQEAVALLKEQEAVKPVITPWAENEDDEFVIAKKECGRCGYQFFTEKPNYCENCGAPILWEGR